MSTDIRQFQKFEQAVGQLLMTSANSAGNVSQLNSNSDSASGSVPADVQESLCRLVERSQKVMSHAWMVRTFVKHSDEVEDFPELNEMARAIFDVFRAVETQVDDPAAYFKTVRKKLSKLKSAADQFQKDAWHASTHTNFQQAAIAAKFLGEQLQELLTEAESLLPRPAPAAFVPPGSKCSPIAESVRISSESQPEDGSGRAD